MLYYLSEWLPYPPWSVFHYITLRSAGAAATALLVSLGLGRWMIDALRRLELRQNYRDQAEASSERHRDTGKWGTPTMGGLLIVLALDISVIMWARWNHFVLLTMLSVVVLAGLGFYDDWLKVSRRNSRGVPSRLKLGVQITLACAVMVYLWARPASRPLVEQVHLPFLKHAVMAGVPLVGAAVGILAIVGSSNAVNLTDGMDGLAIGCTLIVSGVLAVLTYVAGNKVMANYLLIPQVPDAAELTVICSALLGSALGFLWYNCHPAEVFMGDTGSLALGGALGTMAVLIHQPFILLIAGGVFVLEAVSVMVQVGWFKFTKKRLGTGQRVFRMSPLHHHFRELGWAESKIVTRFYIVGVLCALAAFSTLKLR